MSNVLLEIEILIKNYSKKFGAVDTNDGTIADSDRSYINIFLIRKTIKTGFSELNLSLLALSQSLMVFISVSSRSAMFSGDVL